MRVLEDADEVALAQALTVAAEQLARNCAHVTGTSSAALPGNLINRAAHEVERLITRQPHTTDADSIARLLNWSGRARRNWCDCVSYGRFGRWLDARR